MNARTLTSLNFAPVDAEIARIKNWGTEALAAQKARREQQAIAEAEKFLIPATPAGCIRFETTFRDVDLVCHLEYTEADGDGHNEPHYPEDCVLVAAYVRGVNVASLLSEDDCRDLEVSALEARQ